MGDLDCDVLVDMDCKLSAGDTVPDCNRALSMGALDWDLACEGLTVGGRMVFLLLAARPLPGRGSPAILRCRLLNVRENDEKVCLQAEEVNSPELFRVPRVHAIVQHLCMRPKHVINHQTNNSSIERAASSAMPVFLRLHVIALEEGLLTCLSCLPKDDADIAGSSKQRSWVSR